MQKGADFKTLDINGWSPIVWALIQGNYDSADILINYGFNLDEVIFNEIPLLIFFVKEENYEVTEYLIKKNAYIDIRDDLGKTPLMYAAEKGNLELVKLLLKNGANPFKSDKFGTTPFLFAIENNFIKVSDFIHEEILKIRNRRLKSRKN